MNMMAVSYTHLDVYKRQVIELPDMDEGISPRGVIMGNGTGVISQLEMHNFNFDIRML